MWTYEQSSGKLLKDDGTTVGMGYSGHMEGRNQPASQEVRNVGPIPRGIYKIGPPVVTETHGPFVMSLTPILNTDTFGRSGFLMHGDSKIKPGTASEGCIIQARDVRECVWRSGDHSLQVVAGPISIQGATS